MQPLAGQHQVGVWKSLGEELAHKARRSAVRWRQPGEHRIRLDDRVTDRLRVTVKDYPGGFVKLVP